jgi:hypothetical protein
MQLDFLKPLTLLNFKITSALLCMHTACFDIHWSSSGVSKIADETDETEKIKKLL